MDNCLTHPIDLMLQHIKLVFLPPNTSVIQLLGQLFIKAFKYHYREELARKVVMEIDVHNLSTSSSVNTTVKFISLLGVMQFIKMSWDSVTINAIKIFFLSC